MSAEDEQTWDPEDGEYDGDGWCMECGDPFHYDDTGGYNPPCACGFHCRSCHEAVESNGDSDDYDRDEDFYPDDDETTQQATNRFWDGRIGHANNVQATDDDESGGHA